MISYFKNLSWPKINWLLAILIIAYFIFVFSICLFKYFTFGYNGLDLAIYNQVFYNSSLGNLFQFTIHPSSYLGDHFELIIFLLIPFYALFKSPITLLAMQTFFLALAAWPLYLIAKKYLSPLKTLLVLLFYFFNPVTLNINIFEFHILALLPFFLFWAFYFYDQNKFRPFLIFAALCLLVREDVSFIVFMFGLIALLDKKSWKWVLTPLIAATCYFLLALKGVSFFSVSGNYKFLFYYSWLGQNIPEIITNLFLKFPQVISHILTISHLEIALGFGLVFLFLPFWRPKYLLLILGIFLQFILGSGGGELILRTHYGSSFLAIFCLALIFSLKALSSNQKLLHFYRKYSDVLIILLAIGLTYNFLVLGPLPSFLKQVISADYQQVKIKKEFVKQIPAQASVVTSYDLLPNLSSRPKIYSLNYIFLNKQQFFTAPFPLPPDTQFFLINTDDFLTFPTQYAKNEASGYQEAKQNFLNLLSQNNFQVKDAWQNLILLGKNYDGAGLTLYQTHETAPQINYPQKQRLNDQLDFLGSNYSQDKAEMSLFFQAKESLDKDYCLEINGRLFPLGAGLYPSSLWPKDKIIQLNLFGFNHDATINLFNIEGLYLSLNSLGTIDNLLAKKELIGKINLQ